MSTESAAADSAWAYSPEAEQSLIGAILLDNRVVGRVAEIVTDADFYTDDHRAIFRIAKTMIRAGGVADLTTLPDALKLEAPELFRNGELATYLAQLAQNTPSSLHAEHYARLVRKRAIGRRINALALSVTASVRAPAGREPGDLLRELQLQARALADEAAPGRTLRASSAADFVGREFPPLSPLLEPFLFEKCLAMIHAKRGVGKTHLALACAWAISSGGTFLSWRAPRPRGCLYIDGEMPAQLMQKRLRELGSGSGDMPELFRLVTPDEQGRPMPDLATAAGQDEIDALVQEDTSLIVIDNLSCLVRSGGAENESESWGVVAEWALRHRRAGRAVLFIHHSGKTGAQRGTSKREDLLDVVINLRRPAEYQEADGAVFEIIFEKARSLTGEDIAPLEARLELAPGGGYAWAWSSAATKLQDRILALWDGGALSLGDVMREAPSSKSHAHKTLAAAWMAGKLKREYPSKSRAQRKETS